MPDMTPHGKNSAELGAMTLVTLRSMARSYYIKRYTKMRKANLVSSLGKFKTQTQQAPMVRKPAPKKPATKPKAPNPANKPKKQKNPSLYSKKEGGLLAGARAQFEQHYGKIKESPKKKAPAAAPLGKRRRNKPVRYET